MAKIIERMREHSPKSHLAMRLMMFIGFVGANISILSRISGAQRSLTARIRSLCAPDSRDQENLVAQTTRALMTRDDSNSGSASWPGRPE